MASRVTKSFAYLALLFLLACSGPTFPVQAADTAEISLWESVRDSQSAEELRLFLETYPNSRFAPLAKLRLRRLPKDDPSGTATEASSMAVTVPPVPAHKRVGYAGFQIRIAPAELREFASPSYRPKIRLVRVFPFGEAARAGFKTGDDIVTMDGHRPASIVDVVDRLRAAKQSATIRFKVERGDEILDIDMATGDRFALIWDAAHRGDGLAMSFLADDYARGQSVTRNIGVASRWLQKSRDSLDAYALYAHGYYTEYNIIVERSATEARSLALASYLQALDRGDADAGIAASRLLAADDGERALSLAWQAYQIDPGIGARALFDRMEEQDVARYQGVRRRTVLAVAAAWGNSEALRRIGREPASAELSVQQGFQLVRRAAVWGNARAQLDLARLYEKGRGTGRDPQAALTWYRKAAMNGSGSLRGEARAEIGNAYHYGRGTERDARKAFEWFAAASADNNVLGHFFVGFLSGNGRGTTKDQKKAVTYFLKAAEMGDTDAMINLARRYLNGNGTTEDGREAARWFRRAIEKGEFDGHCGLGDLHYYGKGGNRQSYKKAAEAYRIGSEKGSAVCRFDLGFLHENGLGVRKSRSEAIRLYRLSADDDERSADRLKELGVANYNPEHIQQLLTDLGYDVGPVDGKPGKQTRAAIRAFQEAENLTVNGEPSAALLQHLRDVRRRAQVSNQTVAPANGLDAQDEQALAGLENVADL